MVKSLDQNINISEVELLSAEEHGKKLGLLIASLDVDEATREAMFALIPAMSLEQLRELTTVLEASLAAAATAGVDKQLHDAFDKVAKDYAGSVKRANAETGAAMEEIAKSLSV